MTSCILWLRQDLRLHDNPALLHALEHHDTVYPVFVYDPENAADWAPGGARRVWLHHALNNLNTDLGDKIRYFHGKADDIIPHIAKESGRSAVYWNRCYEPWRTQRDKTIKSALKDNGLECQSFNALLLWEPWDITKDDGTPYRVFTPFYRKGCLGYGEPNAPADAPKALNALTRMEKHFSFEGRALYDVSDLNLLPAPPIPAWDQDMAAHWDISENGALDRFNHFCENGLNGYKTKRDRPDLDHVSKMSPYLHHGQISPRRMWHRVRQMQANGSIPEKDADHFLSELGWREFSYNLLYNNHELPRTPLQQKFTHFPWADMRKNQDALERWQAGQTGYPLVDAAMRQLYATGWMHNRLRMVVGSFLIKDLLIHWHYGEEWFWDCLVDADLASNAASWQWIAGCGADAAPYFRVFNPITQSQKFDPDGAFIREWVPEIAALPDKYIHSPWISPKEILSGACVTLGKTYPHPIVDHAEARKTALAAFEELKQYS